jgi:hypothetical protein
MVSLNNVLKKTKTCVITKEKLLLKIEGEQVSAVTKIVCRARKGYCGDMLSVQGW